MKPPADGPPGEVAKPAEPKSAEKPSDPPPGSDSLSHPNALPTLPEPDTNPTAAPENHQPQPGKIEVPSPVTLGSADAPSAASNPVIPAPTLAPVGDRATAQAAKPAKADSPAVVEAPASRLLQEGVRDWPPPAPPPLFRGPQPRRRCSMIEAPAADSSTPRTPERVLPKGPDNRHSQVAIEPQSSEPPAANKTLAQAGSNKSKAIPEQSSDGWVSLPNRGKMPVEDAPDAETSQKIPPPWNLFPRATSAAMPPRTSTSNSNRKNPRGRLSSTPPAADPAPPPVLAPSWDRGRRRAESRRAHIVESQENFWTISRLYYNSGRYYRTLWKANAAKYPKINELHVGDVILIPAVEDLDTEYIDTPRERAPAAFTNGGRRRSGGADSLAESSAVSAGTSSSDGDRFTTTRTNARSSDGVPIRGSSRTEFDPDLEPPRPRSRRARTNTLDRSGRPMNRPLGADDDAFATDDPDTRTAARPRAARRDTLTRFVPTTPCDPSPATCLAIRTAAT